MSKFYKVIAIDGPAGSGKSTIAKLLAENLKAIYIDSGAMYRAIGIYFKEVLDSIESTDESRKLLEDCHFAYKRSNNEVEIEIADKVYGNELRAHEVSEYASKVSQYDFVRDFLLEKQQSLGKKELSVMEGRDIGSVVFPEAFCKIYLSANEETRAKRRLNDLGSRGIKDKNLDQVLTDIKLRDERDKTRDRAPLVIVEDAVEVDTSDLNIDEVVAKLRSIAINKAQEHGLNLDE